MPESEKQNQEGTGSPVLRSNPNFGWRQPNSQNLKSRQKTQSKQVQTRTKQLNIFHPGLIILLGPSCPWLPRLGFPFSRKPHASPTRRRPANQLPRDYITAHHPRENGDIDGPRPTAKPPLRPNLINSA
ncbi:hypothetical protein VTO42DRAFT_4636 [Malbranchea cinnamomea]